MDLTILIAAHVLLMPLWLVIWTCIPLLIRLGDAGPVFFRQERAGRNGKAFTIMKFRTMVVDSDKIGPAWTVDGDVRITTIGRILRRTALDELPSILSIWKGDMSFVGPRALAQSEQSMLELEIPDFHLRLNVLPGLTGLSQVYNKTDSSIDKIYHDLEYIRRMNLWLDLTLLVLSVKNTIFARWDQRSGKNHSI